MFSICKTTRGRRGLSGSSAPRLSSPHRPAPRAHLGVDLHGLPRHGCRQEAMSPHAAMSPGSGSSSTSRSSPPPSALWRGAAHPGPYIAAGRTTRRRGGGGREGGAGRDQGGGRRGRPRPLWCGEAGGKVLEAPPRVPPCRPAGLSLSPGPARGRCSLCVV